MFIGMRNSYILYCISLMSYKELQFGWNDGCIEENIDTFVRLNQNERDWVLRK
jgi:hypothetical protein